MALLVCGCAPNARKVTPDGDVPSCAVHGCTEELVPPPSLEGRMARCSCSREPRQSNTNLPFFEYRGPGSRDGTAICKCGYSVVAHDKKIADPKSVVSSVCDSFEARGPNEFDLYYCGHGGWN